MDIYDKATKYYLMIYCDKFEIIFEEKKKFSLEYFDGLYLYYSKYTNRS